MVFILMGPMMVVGSFFVLTGQIEISSIFVSIPIGILTTSILHANNIKCGLHFDGNIQQFAPYIDEMDDHVNDTYAAWPTRLYLVGLDGKIVYGGGLGPYDFKPAKLKAAIEESLKQLSTS